MDTTPGALVDAENEADVATTPDATERRRLLDFAKRASQLHGPDQDRKLGSLTQQVKKLLAGGDNPIVFCRFIDTAHYVAEHLADTLGSKKTPVTVISVTGELPPAERERRVAALVAACGECKGSDRLDAAARRDVGNHDPSCKLGVAQIGERFRRRDAVLAE